jgi:hypothetical protein
MTLSTLLANMPDLLNRTLEQHRPDGRGRCVACRDAGSDAAARWPCMAYDLAEQAHALARPDISPGRHAR